MERILNMDCRDAMRGMDAESIDAIVTDPPYGLEFMGKGWDRGVPGVEFWTEAYRVAKPGAHLLAFGGTRTFHRLTCAIEDAGFEVRDCIMWVYGSGFPKSHNLRGEWSGWGTALKPAWEPIIVARKPLAGTVADNVMKHGTGAINVDACRVGSEGGTRKSGPPSFAPSNSFHGGLDGSLNGGGCESIKAGRWPANLIHDGSGEVLELFPDSKDGVAVGGRGRSASIYGTQTGGQSAGNHGYGGSGSAARFFYCAKASKQDRDEGLTIAESSAGASTGRKDGSAGINAYAGASGPAKNFHPTVKPTALMRYLCRLVTPPGGVVLDPFMGSGSTGKAARAEGVDFIGCELSAEYCAIAEQRIASVAPLMSEVG